MLYKINIKSAEKKTCLGFTYYQQPRNQYRLASLILQVARSRLGLEILQEIKEQSACDFSLRIPLSFFQTAISRQAQVHLQHKHAFNNSNMSMKMASKGNEELSIRTMRSRTIKCVYSKVTSILDLMRRLPAKKRKSLLLRKSTVNFVKMMIYICMV